MKPRFHFVPSRVLAGIGVVAVGVAIVVGPFAVQALIADRRIFFSLGLIGLGVVVAIVGLGIVLSSFSRGCPECRVELETRTGDFAFERFDSLAGAIVQRDAAALVRLGSDPLPAGSIKISSLQIDVCPRCQRVGVARALVRVLQEGHWVERKRHPKPGAVFNGDAMHQVSQLVSARTIRLTA